jgi:hypothetical protein
VRNAAGQRAHRFHLLRLPELLLQALLRLLGSLSFGDVDDRADDVEAFGRPHRREADLDGHFAAILPAAKEVAAGAHAACLGSLGKMGAMSGMQPSQSAGEEHLHALSEELGARVAEHALDLTVHEDDHAGGVDHDGAGRR